MDNPLVEGVTITRGSASDIPRLEPLWVAVHHQHMASMPELGPYVSDAETWAADTWVTGERVAELESISVLPEYRGAGIETTLLEECHRGIEALGVDDVIIGALPGNTGAIRLYERHGYRPAARLQF